MRSTTVVLSLLVAATVGAQVRPPAWETGAIVYDGAGNIKTMGVDQFRYDAMGRLVSATYGPGQSQTIEYDRYGNLGTMTTNGQAKTFGVDAATNRVSQSTASVFATYDAAGRITSTLANADRFEYDALDMVTRSTVDGVTKVHLYTAAGERLASVTVSNGAETRSDWTLRDASGKVLRRLEKNAGTWTWKEDYVYGAGQLLAAENSAGETSHFFPDHLGTPRLITDRRGGQVAIHKYWPFGDEFTDPNQDSQKLKFTGHERDAATLDYMHARYYAPKWGRFLSVDPTWESADLARPQTWNRYAYVQNNPVNKTDPDGRNPVPVAVRLAAVACASNPGCTDRALRLGINVAALTTSFSDRADEALRDLEEDRKYDVPADPNDLLDAGYDETSHPEAAAAGHRTFENPDTGDKLRFDKGKPGEPGHEGRDHYHRENPNATGKADQYLDKTGKPVRRGSDGSHLYPKGFWERLRELTNRKK